MLRKSCQYKYLSISLIFKLFKVLPVIFLKQTRTCVYGSTTDILEFLKLTKVSLLLSRYLPQPLSRPVLTILSCLLAPHTIYWSKQAIIPIILSQRYFNKEETLKLYVYLLLLLSLREEMRNEVQITGIVWID